jgi:hypothetical protein
LRGVIGTVEKETTPAGFHRLANQLPIMARTRNRPQIRLLIITFSVEFVLSLLIVCVASVLRQGEPPRWMVFLDISLAVGLFLTLVLLTWLSKGQVRDADFRRCYQLFVYLPLLLLLAWLFLGHRVKWDVLLAGRARRGFVFGMALPLSISLWKVAVGSSRGTKLSSTGGSYQGERRT